MKLVFHFISAVSIIIFLFFMPVNSSAQPANIRMIGAVSVPLDFPVLKPSIIKDGVSPGRLFLNNWGGTPYILIFNNDGTPYFYQRVENRARDFKVQPNGVLTRRYITNKVSGFVSMDSNYTIIDTMVAAHGYGTDEHELYMLADGHYFLIALDYRSVNMAELHPGGNPNATIVDNIVQEFDAQHHLVFEWNSKYLFKIVDAIHEDLNAGFIDYVHMNSIAVDYDGNIIISSRHQSEVTKINRQSGEIIWRLGGKYNQFNMVNDNYSISYQHYARPVPGEPGNYTVFDNGNFHQPQFSRAVEFHIDTLTMTATKVWEYRHSPDRFTWWMGNAQRLPNGNTQVNWADGSLPKFTEITPAGEVVYEANFEDYIHSYRAYRFAWDNPAKKPYLIAESYPDNVSLIFNLFGVANTKEYLIYSGKQVDQLSIMDTVNTPYYTTLDLDNEATYYFQVVAVDSLGKKSDPSNLEKVETRFVIPGENYVRNGNFSQGGQSWIHQNFEGAQSTFSVEDGIAHIAISEAGTEDWHIQFIQENLPLINGRKYRLIFEAWADADRVINPRIERNGGNWENYSKLGAVLIKSSRMLFEHEFTMDFQTDYHARLNFNLGTSDADVYLDNISLIEVDPNSPISEDSKIPKAFTLRQNYPNPFNPSTTIEFQLTEISDANLSIFNIAGQKIQTLINSHYSPGIYKIVWDGKDENGRSLSSGVYFYRLKNGNKIESKKMILLR